MLTLGIQKADGKQLIWRGTATGTINADAASNDLKSAVEGILKSFLRRNENKWSVASGLSRKLIYD